MELIRAASLILWTSLPDHSSRMNRSFSVMKARQSTFVSALAGSLFLILGVILVVLGSKFKSTENNFWLGFIGLGFLIESSYLALHFLLKPLAKPETPSL